jgi:hypothetical protein
LPVKGPPCAFAKSTRSRSGWRSSESGTTSLENVARQSPRVFPCRYPPHQSAPVSRPHLKRECLKCSLPGKSEPLPRPVTWIDEHARDQVDGLLARRWPRQRDGTSRIRTRVKPRWTSAISWYWTQRSIRASYRSARHSPRHNSSARSGRWPGYSFTPACGAGSEIVQYGLHKSGGVAEEAVCAACPRQRRANRTASSPSR